MAIQLHEQNTEIHQRYKRFMGLPMSPQTRKYRRTESREDA